MFPHIAVSKELDGSYANDTLWRWAMCWEGWGRWGNWHSLQLMSTLCRKIRSIWCYKPKYEPPSPPPAQTMWELICLGQGGPRLADPEGEIITPEVETPSGLLQERRQQKGVVDQEALLARHLEVPYWPLVHRPADQEATFQTFYPLTAASWWVHKGQMPSSQPVWRNEGIFEAIVLPPLADSLWFDPQVNHRELLRRSSFFRSPEVYFDSHLLSEGSCRRSSLKFQGQVINGRKTMFFCKCCTYMKQLKTEFITNATVAHGVNKQLSVQHSRTRWTSKSSVCLQPVQPLKWGQTALSCLAAVCLMLAWLPLFLT